MNHISVGSLSDAGVEINGRLFTWTWLRDHSQEAGDYHAAGRQRLIDTSAIDGSLADVSVDGDVLKLVWSDGATVSYSSTYLAALGLPDEVYPTRTFAPIPWDRSSVKSRVAPVPYTEYIDDDEAATSVLRALGTDGFALVEAVPLDRDGTRAVFERIGYVRKTLFGELWNLRSDGEYDDTGSTPLDISPHTDGTYSNDAPGFLGLHCLNQAEEGGGNTLVDGFNLAELLKASDPAAFATLSTVDIPGQYIGDGGYLVARRPLFRMEGDECVQVSFNNHDRAPFWLPSDDMAELYRSLAAFEELLHDPDNQFELLLPSGTMLIFDNWRCLHGRRAFSGNRHLIGGYLNREDYESALRLLSPRPFDMVG